MAREMAKLREQIALLTERLTEGTSGSPRDPP